MQKYVTYRLYTMSQKMKALCALLLFSCLRVAAQEEGWRKPSQLKANLSLLGVGANYELRLLKYTTLNLEAGVELGLAYSSNSYSYFENDHWAYAGVPVFSGEVRQYYGIARRMAKGKKVNNNAGSFVSITGGTVTAPLFSKNFATGTYGFVTPAWGMQRSWGKHINFEGRFGWMFTPRNYFNDAANYLSIRLSVGYVIW